jgi:hypothetical protein
MVKLPPGALTTSDCVAMVKLPPGALTTSGWVAMVKLPPGALTTSGWVAIVKLPPGAVTESGWVVIVWGRRTWGVAAVARLKKAAVRTNAWRRTLIVVPDLS